MSSIISDDEDDGNQSDEDAALTDEQMEQQVKTEWPETTTAQLLELDGPNTSAMEQSPIDQQLNVVPQEED